MGKICWDFPLLGTGNESGSNIAAITLFQNSGNDIMDALAREVCQNSLDAKNRKLDDNVPVKVEFSLQNVNKQDFPDVFSEYEKSVDSAIAYWTKSPLSTKDIIQFLNSIKEYLQREVISILVMRDRNTTGLNGVEPKEGEKSYWDLLVNTEGISIKQDEKSAGSFGIGKNAPFAYSRLNLIFYNTLAQDGGRAFEGVARLVTTQKEYKGTMRKTQPIGKYLYLEDSYTGRPILPSDRCSLANLDIFKREEGELGTDVAIAGFDTDDCPDWERETAISVIKNYILAIINGKMEVTITSSGEEKYFISKDNLEDLLYRVFKDEQKLLYTVQIYETITNPDRKQDIKIAEKDDLTIFLKYKDSYRQSLARFRATGMLINRTNESIPHFSVVVLVNDVGTGMLETGLRDSEPPQHTEWRQKNVKNKTLRNRVGRYIRSINAEVRKQLDEFDNSTISKIMDAGIGNYIPDSSHANESKEGSDGLRNDVKINRIEDNNGNIIFENQYSSGETAQGEKSDRKGHKAGKKKKRKKRTKKPITVVTPGGNGASGVAQGSGKVIVKTPVIDDFRTFYISANKYRLFALSPQNYSNVYIEFFAEREDSQEDSVTVKNIKIEGSPLMVVNSNRVGPISLNEGSNQIHVEFENSEIMAVKPVFTMEVINE